jgi:hypothetical protein
MKATLTAITFATAIIAAAPARTLNRDGDAAPTGVSSMRVELVSNGEPALISPENALAAYGIRCTFKSGSDSQEQRRPLRWLFNRCRPWVA